MASYAAAGSHLYAQQMNNSAVSCIEIGLYDRAVASLKRAIRLSKAQQPSRNSMCDCYQCTLDGCIVRSEAQTQTSTTPSTSTSNASMSLQIPSGDEARKTQKREDDHESNAGSNDTGYIYRTPIKVKCQGHTMGPALYLIVTFNLALTNHLIALKHTHNVRERNNHAGKARELYKLTYEMQANLLRHESQKDTSTISLTSLAALRSIRFELIILNNNSQVYGLTQNESEKEDCLKKLHSTIMIVVDHKARTIGTEHRLLKIDLDGFLKNTAHLVLEPVCTSDAA
jgi:hypothetical protein